MSAERRSGWVRVRGAAAGAIVFWAVAGPLLALVPAEGIGLGASGGLVAGLDDAMLRAALLLVASLVAGVASSVVAGDYVSGTSLIALTVGVGGLAAAAPPLARAAPAADPSERAVLLTIEVLVATVVVLAGYSAAWQTDLRWTLPRRAGPPYEKKRVGPRELLLTNVPAMLAIGAASAAVGTVVVGGVLPEGAAAVGAWALICLVVADAGVRLLPVRSTFFVWTAPGLALVAACGVGLALESDWPGRIAERLAGLPDGLIVPAGALGAVAGYLTARRGVRPDATQVGTLLLGAPETDE